MSEITTEETNVPSTDIRANLKEIFDRNDFDTYAHGTDIEIGEKIMNEGLRSRNADFKSITISLFDRKRTFDEQIEEVMVKIGNWPHLESKNIVIIMLPVSQETSEKTTSEPKFYINQLGGTEKQSKPARFFREIPDAGHYDLQYVLPPEYIKGFVDVQKNKFIPNPKFNPLPPDLIPQKKIPKVSQTNSNPSESVSPPDLLP